MPRIARKYQLSNYYHVIVQGDEKKFIFQKDSSKSYYLNLILKNSERNHVKILAYCIMDNHAHILVYSSNHEQISKMMSQTGTSYGIYFSKLRNNIGHVFRERFKSEIIKDQKHLICCIKYIHENPVKSNMVRSCVQYKFSSYHEYLQKYGCYLQIKSLNVFDTIDLDTVFSNHHIDYSEQFLEPEKNYENIEDVFSNLIQSYNLNKLSNSDILEIYTVLKKRCNITKITTAKLLNINIKRLSRITLQFKNDKCPF